AGDGAHATPGGEHAADGTGADADDRHGAPRGSERPSYTVHSDERRRHKLPGHVAPAPGPRRARHADGLYAAPFGHDPPGDSAAAPGPEFGLHRRSATAPAGAVPSAADADAADGLPYADKMSGCVWVLPPRGGLRAGLGGAHARAPHA